ncbi:MAG: M48 family metallopeptidase [Candidatus Polarisedimenticolia bacterium]
MRRLVLAGIPAFALLSAFAVGCTSQHRVSAETSVAKALISDEQSEEIGRQVHAELEQQGISFTDDPVVQDYVDNIGGRILYHAEKDRPDIHYHIHVIDDLKTVNAFATPGGHIYVFTGLINAAANEAEVAGVIAHEAGHVVGRHVERQIVNAYGLQALSALALGNDPSTIKQLSVTLAGTGLLRAHSRSEEIEADEYGARYMAAAGYDPQALISFFRTLEKQSQGSPPRVLAWLQTHPTEARRIDNLEEYIKENDLVGARLGDARHQEIKRRLISDEERASN